MTTYTDRMMRPMFGANESPRSCPLCGCTSLGCGSTRRHAGTVLRYRYCADCGAGVKTTEVTSLVTAATV